MNETLVVDYAADPLTIPSGPGKTFTFTMDGDLGELTEASETSLEHSRLSPMSPVASSSAAH
ncbi:MAG UNVERIFIED_CONTAM: hypothetical protein LVR18_02915 [Planctomycetaceae bacterium]|jgi:hypothetical protein